MERQGDLSFDFDGGSCRQYSLNEQNVLFLCFQYRNEKMCHKYDGNRFSTLDVESNHGHAFSYFSTYQNKPFIIGGYDDYGYHKYVEIFENGETDEYRWIRLEDYPLGNA